MQKGGNMKKSGIAGFVCFGEVNTPYERLVQKAVTAENTLNGLGFDFTYGGLVIDEDDYSSADRAICRLKKEDLSCLIVCVAGWVPSHVVIRVTDPFRHLPILLWGLCGWRERGTIITTADQAGTSALRPAFEAMGYRFMYVYSTMDGGAPLEQTEAFVNASFALDQMRHARIGTMGYRDMLLYGTQFEGNSLRAALGVEVEPFEMLEMVQELEHLSDTEVKTWTDYVKNNWRMDRGAADQTVVMGVKYALAIGRKIEKRGWGAVTLLDVDGMKKLLHFPPAIIFMLLNKIYHVQVIPENDILGSVTQLMMAYATRQDAPYMEYYEFFSDHMLIGVPDFIPESMTDGPVTLTSTSFGQLDHSLLNVSRARTGYVTCSRLNYVRGEYRMHSFTGEAKLPSGWEECGWKAPAPQLPSLAIYPDSCTVETFSQRVGGQHTILSYGDQSRVIRSMCHLAGISLI